MKLVEKAWVIDPVNIKNNHNFFAQLFYAETQGKAKNKAVTMCFYDDYKDEDGEDLTFLTVRVKRAKKADVYLVDGNRVTLLQINYANEVKERDLAVDKLVKESKSNYAYIKKGGYYYRPNNNGYTEYLIEAGVYPIQDAANTVKSCSLGDFMQVIPINTKEHNDYLNKKIIDLQTRLIK